MAQQMPRPVWAGPPSEIMFVLGLGILVIASMNLYKRSQLKHVGVVVEGVVRTAALSCVVSPLNCARATDQLEVAYQNDAGQRQIRKIYARSHTYFEGQPIFHANAAECSPNPPMPL
jgi:hypothetical protein